MSFQAKAVNMGLRFLKRKMFTDTDHIALREMVANASKRSPRPPAHIEFVEDHIEDLSCLWVRDVRAHKDKIILYLHGGGFIFCSAHTTHKDILWRMSSASKCRVLAVDYRLAPENPFPAALDDAVKIYQWLLSQGYKPENIAIAGDSAGGGLTYSSVLKIRDMGLPVPAATVGMSPWTDLAVTGESVMKNLKRDFLIPGDGLSEGAEYYLNGADPRDPYASPLYGDPEGLPPTLIQVSTDEVLLDDARRLADKYKNAGVSADIELWDGLPHVWQAMAMIIPEGQEAIKSAGQFIYRHLHKLDA